MLATRTDPSTPKDNPAAAGTIVAVLMTGAGAMVPAIGDGQIGPLAAPFPKPALPLTRQSMK